MSERPADMPGGEAPIPGSENEPPAPATTAAGAVEGLSAMTPRFNLLFHFFARRFFRHFDLDDATVTRLRELEDRGAVVYVMRYASRLDYFLFNALFVREGLKLSRFANGIRFFYYRPLWQSLRLAWRKRRELFREPDQEAARSQVRQFAETGESTFLFLRTARLREQLRTKRRAVEHGRQELDLLQEVVSTIWDSGRPVSLVPLALFWSKGPRSQQGFLNLSYGATTRPSDLAKVTSFLTTYRGLCVKVGEPIDLGAFIEEQRAEGPHRVARKVRRAILTFLYREEKVVEGPTIRPRYRVQQSVVSSPAVQAAIRDWAETHDATLERARIEAAKMFREISAHMNSTFLAGLNFVVGMVLRRLFVSIEVAGLDKIASYAKRHPLVLAPSHRSYFDFLIVSVMFYGNHLVPPHIAARDNMAFGPFGFLWRRAGAFFLRRSFDDPLYKVVFRSYVAHLIKQGFTQEFFIEGGRSRTGKTLAPRLGMLSWNVEAFLASNRRDLFFVPIAITYERLVEEGALVGELEGEAKQTESMLGLVRARKFLSRRFGSVFVNFGEPISLADALGSKRALVAGDGEEAVETRRVIVESLGNRIVERINWAVVPNATSVASCALLGDGRRGFFRDELAARMQQIVDLLRLQDVRLTPELDRDEGAFRDSIGTMIRSDLIASVNDPRGEVLYFENGRRRTFDLYRNAIIHYLATPSFLARRLLTNPTLEELRRELPDWLELFYQEFFTPRGEVLAAHFDAFIDHFERFSWVEIRDGRVVATEKGIPVFRFLAEQTRGFVEVYYATACAVGEMEGPMTRKELRAAAAEQFDRAELLGEVERRESVNEPTIANAISLMERLGHVERSSEAEGKDVVYVPGALHAEVEALHSRLASALHPR